MGLSVAGKLSIFAVIFLLSLQLLGTFVHSVPIASTQRSISTTKSSSKDGNTTESGDHVQKIKIAKFDFEHIATPFIVTVWVLLASLLKVGKLIQIF